MFGETVGTIFSDNRVIHLAHIHKRKRLLDPERHLFIRLARINSKHPVKPENTLPRRSAAVAAIIARSIPPSGSRESLGRNGSQLYPILQAVSLQVGLSPGPRHGP